MQLNGVTLVDRFNRPSVGGKVAVRTLFINDGEFIDPYDISACTIFAKLSNASPSSIVDVDDGLIKSDATSVVLMNFGVSGNPVNALPHDGMLGRVTDPAGSYAGWTSPTATTADGGALWGGTNGYFAHAQASGIYRNGVGDYVCVLDGNISLSGGYNIRYPYQEGIEVANAASSVQDYIDVWTVKLFDTSEYQLFINSFSLYNDTFTTITEPLLITTRNRLLNKKLRYGEKIDMKITTDITVQNSTLPEETKNILKDYQITNPKISISKVSEDSINQSPWTSVVADVAATLTTDNTILYTYDTTAATSQVQKGAGTYWIKASYTYLTQNFITPPYYFTIT
jgi:hypothetical protein